MILRLARGARCKRNKGALRQDSSLTSTGRTFVMVRKTASAAMLVMLGAAVASAGEIEAAQKMNPMHAISADFGERHYVSFFTNVAGHCDLTVMSAAQFDEAAKTASSDAERLRLIVEPGQAARIDASSGGSLQFGCAADAASMKMTALSSVADR
jgi:hypothetical protein